MAVIWRRIDFVRRCAPGRDADSARERRRAIRPTSGRSRKHVEIEQPGAQAVVDVVGVVGDVVGDRGALRLEPAKWSQLEIEQRVELDDRLAAAGPSAALPPASGQRPVVLDQALQRLPGQVQPVELGVAPLQPRDDRAATARCGRSRRTAPSVVQRVLAGMAERRVAEVVDQRHAPRRGPRRSAAPARACARSAPPRSSASAGCGSGRPRARRRPASCASAGGRRSSG